MTAQEQGFRYCASPDRKNYRWLHPAEFAVCFSDWADVTDLTDDEFAEFVAAKTEG